MQPSCNIIYSNSNKYLSLPCLYFREKNEREDLSPERGYRSDNTSVCIFCKKNERGGLLDCIDRFHGIKHILLTHYHH